MGSATVFLWCSAGFWFLAYSLNVIAAKNVLITSNESDIPATSTNHFLAGRWRWIDFTMIQHLLGSLLAIVLVKVMGKSISIAPLEHKRVILIASICNVTGNLVANAAFTMLPSYESHVVESCQPLATIVLVRILYGTKVSLHSSDFLSLSLFVLGIIAVPIALNSFSTILSGLAATVSLLAYSVRNVVVKELQYVWGNPLQKFLAVSVTSFFLVVPLWLIKVAFCFHSVTTASLLKFTAAGIPHSMYSIASFNVLESVVSPVSHAMLVVLFRLVYYFAEIEIVLSWNLVISFLGILLGGYLYSQGKPSRFTVVTCFVNGLLLLTRGLINIETNLYHKSATTHADRSAAMLSANHDISMAWVYETPLNTSNIQILAKYNQESLIHVFCGTEHCVRAVTELSMPNVSAEFAMVSDITKDTPLQQWMEHHPLNKLVAGRKFETHLQVVTILGILWKHGGFYVSPTVTVRSSLDSPTNCDVPLVSPKMTIDQHLPPSVLDVAYFCSYNPFINNLQKEYVIKYPARNSDEDSSQFNFFNSAWRAAMAKCSGSLSCPEVFKTTMVETRISEKALVSQNHFGLSQFQSAASLYDELNSLVNLQFLPRVDTLLSGTTKEPNVEAFFDSRWGIADGSWPPPNGVNPVMLSVRTVNQTKKKWGDSSLDFFKKRMPVGCEDSNTRNFMREHKIEAYLSGPMMLLLSHQNSQNEGIFATDLKAGTLKLLPGEVNDMPSEPIETSNNVERMRRVLTLKEQFGRAKLVVTGNIHHALLCAALETPVLFLYASNEMSNTDLELVTDLSPLFHTLDLGSMTEYQAKSRLANFSWHDVAPNPNLGTLMKLKATSWDVIRGNQVLYDTAKRLGTVPMPPIALKHKESLLFHLIFTTSANSAVKLFTTKASQSGSFNWRHMRTVESIFLHHPASRIIVHSNTLSQSVFDGLTEVGYSITVKRYDLKEMLKGSPAETFLSKLNSTSKGQYWYSHVTDLLRLLVLHQWGGVYMDTDMILVRPLSSLKMNTLGFENHKNTILNGALMMFEMNNSFIHACLVQYANNYQNNWGGNGPELLTRMWKKTKPKDVHTVSHEHFYMMAYDEVKKQCFQDTGGKTFTSNMAILKSDAYAVHLNSKITGNLGLGEDKLVKGSLCSYILNSYCVLCNRMY